MMDDQAFSKMVSLGVVRFDNGRITIKGRTAIFLPAEVLLLSQKLIADKVSKAFADEHMYELGVFHTLSGSPKYYAERKVLGTVLQGEEAKGDPAFEMGRQVLGFAGYGSIEWVELFNNGEKGVVRIRNSPFAEEYLKMYGKADRPICHYLRGLLSGGFQARHGKEYSVEETVCKATGLAMECLFRFAAIR